MLLRSAWRFALAATAAFAPAAVSAQETDANPSGQSVFISPGNDVAFAVTIPDDISPEQRRQVFFSIRVAKKNSWGAVGLGSDDMKGALFLIIYQSEDGKNVTFSPRVGFGNYEPAFYDEVQYTVVQNSTGIFGDYMMFTAVCTDHCRSWTAGNTNSGYLDTSSPNSKAIYAVGPAQTLKSNSPSAPLNFHQEYGQFLIDVGRTRGVADAPVLTPDSKMDGATLVLRETGKSDYKAALHAAFMIFFIIGMMNFGIVLLRACGWAKWHAVNQIVATLGVFVGLALGVLTSFYYQRSRNFNSYHQIIGYIIGGFILVQLGLGVKHHLEYRRTQAPTLFGKIHIWTGRLILLLTVLNAFFGFSFAQNRISAIVFGALLVFAALVILFFLRGRQRLFKKKQQFQPVGAQQPPPWRQQSTAYNAGYPSDTPPRYESLSNSQQVGLKADTPPRTNSPWRSGDDKDDEDVPNLGPAQRPQEFT